MATFNFTNTGNIDGIHLGTSSTPYIVDTNVLLASMLPNEVTAFRVLLASSAVSATYSRTAAATSNLTVTSNAHGYAVGDKVYLDFTSGNATDNNYTITSVTTNNFTVTALNNTITSGNVTILPGVISPLNAPIGFYGDTDGSSIGYDFSGFKADLKTLQSSLQTPSHWHIIDIDKRGDLWGIKFADSDSDNANTIRLFGTVTQTTVQPTLANNGQGYVNFAVAASSFEYNIGNINYLDGINGYIKSSTTTFNFRQNFPTDPTSFTIDPYGTSSSYAINGALLDGAVLSSGTLPTSITKFGRDNISDDGTTRMGMYFFNGTFSLDLVKLATTNSKAALSGTITDAVSATFPHNDNGNPQSSTIEKWTINSGTITDSTSTGNISFSSSASFSLNNVKVATGGLELNYGTLEFTSPSGNTSDLTITTPTNMLLNKHLDYGNAYDDGGVTLGNDTFTITSSVGTDINAGLGDDTVNGGAGDDKISGGGGNDTLNGFAGNDTFKINHSGLDSSDPNPYKWSIDASANTLLTSFSQTINGINGPINTSVQNLGRTVIDGGAGLDTVEFINPLLSNGNITLKATLLLPNTYNFSDAPSGFPIKSGNNVITAHVDNGVTTYQAVLAPAANQIGFKFAGWDHSSPYIPNEAIVMSNVEFISYNNQIIDARPLYVASESADTLYAMSERNYLQLLNLFGENNQTNPFVLTNNETYIQQATRLNQDIENQNLDTENQNPFDHYWSNFTFEPTADANFYVLAGGGGNDTLFGTNKEYLVNPITGDLIADQNGNLVNDLLRSGNDVLDGNLGNDTMSGGSGLDVYYVDNASDVIIESALNHEYDFVIASGTYALQANTAVEVLVVHQLFDNESANNSMGYTWFNPYNSLPSSSTSINLTGSNYTTDLIGHDGANTITAGSLAGKLSDDPNIHGAVLVGLAGNDTLTGGEGDDAFFGGADNDTLNGGLGNDRFYMGFTTGYLQDTLTSRNTYLANDPLFTSFALNTTGIINNHPNYLTGGVDTATGGAGIDTVVLDSYSPAETIGGIDSRWVLTSLQRVSETQIRIYTPFDSMTVDSSTELLEFLTKSSEDIQGRAIVPDDQVRQYILPFLPAGDEKAIYQYIGSLRTDDIKVDDQENSPDLAYAPASAFGDFVALNRSVDNLPDQNEFDGLAGNDFIIAGDEYKRIYGGAGNDRIYSYGLDGTRQELFGGDGDDTLSVWLAADSPNAQFTGAGFNQDLLINVPSLLLDGGAGNDTYRISTWNTQETLPTFEIQDSAGTDTIIVSLDLNSNEESWSIWDSGQLSVKRYDGAVFANIAAGVIENIAFSSDNTYFTPWKSFVLVNPTLGATGTFASGKLTGAATNDALISMTGVRLNYDGGAGDDLISLNEISGGIAIGGAGNNIINVRDLSHGGYDNNQQPLIKHTLSYNWTSAGQISEINLNTGFTYVASSTGVSVASDNFQGNQDFFPYVIGGAANDTIQGNWLANILDGGAGDDVIYSGLSDLDNLSIQDTLIGNLGNDILVDQTTHAIMDGGAGNDTYVIESGNSGESVNFRRIIETSSTGADSGGSDTLRGVDTWGIIARPVIYSQTGNVITISTDLLNSQLSVGALVNLDFKSGTAVDNFYTVLSVNGSSFTVASSTSATTSGTVIYADLMNDSHSTFYQWHDSKTLALGGGNDHFVDLGSHAALANGGLYTQNQDGTFNTNFAIAALIDKNAMDFIETNAYDEIQPGIVLKVSFGTGTTNSSEIIFASANGPAFLNGGLGSDHIIDTLANDILVGGEGNDLLISLTGQDIVLAGNGDDQINFQSDGQLISGGLGADRFAVSGTDFDADPATPTILSDFKYWENDKVVLTSWWLDRLMTNMQNPTADDDFSIYLDHNNATTSFYLERNYTAGPGQDIHEKAYLFDLLNNNHSNDSIDLAIFEDAKYGDYDLNGFTHDELNAYKVWSQLDSSLISLI